MLQKRRDIFKQRMQELTTQYEALKAQLNDNETYAQVRILYTALIWSAKSFALQPCWRVFYFKFVHSSTQTKPNTKQDIYLKDVILALS